MERACEAGTVRQLRLRLCSVLVQTFPRMFWTFYEAFILVTGFAKPDATSPFLTVFGGPGQLIQVSVLVLPIRVIT